jgi:hypothetical protein
VWSRNAQSFVKKVFSSVASGVRALLDGSAAFVTLGEFRGSSDSEDEDGPVLADLILLVWADNCQKITAVKMKLIDRGKQVFPGVTSDVMCVLEIVGGEGHLPPWMPQVVNSIHSAMDEDYYNSGRTAVCRISCVMFVGDHHVLNLIMCIPGSSSHWRDTYGHTQSTFWSRFPFDGESRFNVGASAKNFDCIQTFIQRSLEIRAAEKRNLSLRVRAAAEREPDPRIEAVILRLSKCILPEKKVIERALEDVAKLRGKHYAPPLWMYADQSLHNVFNVPPPMHNLFSCQNITIELWQTLVDPAAPHMQQFASMFVGLQKTIEMGEISASMSKMRQIVNGAAVVCEDVMTRDANHHVRVYAYILRFAALIGEQIYSKCVPDARMLLAFEVHTYLWWLIATYLSADIGGWKGKSTYSRSHTQVLYWIDMVHHMPNFYCQWGFPWPWVAEDDFEKSFTLYKDHAQEVHRGTDLLGLRVFTAHKALMTDLLVKHHGSRGGGDRPRTHFSSIEKADIVVHPSIYEWLCKPIRGSRTTNLPVAAVSFKAFLRRVHGRSHGQEHLIEFGTKGEVIFRVGVAAPGDAAPPILHLCFPVAGSDDELEDPVVDARVHCNCNGSCNNARCACFKAGVRCGPRCHRHPNPSCTQPHVHLAEPEGVRADPGLSSFCTCVERDGPTSLHQWFTERTEKMACAPRHAQNLKHLVQCWRDPNTTVRLPLLWRAASRLLLHDLAPLAKRLKKALSMWRDARANMAMNIQSKKFVFHRRLEFYARLLWRRCVEYQYGRRLWIDPSVWQYRTGLLS